MLRPGACPAPLPLHLGSFPSPHTCACRALGEAHAVWTDWGGRLLWLFQPLAASRSTESVCPLTAAWSWGLGRDRGKKSPVHRGVGQRHRPPSQGVKRGQPTGQARAPHDGAGMRYVTKQPNTNGLKPLVSLVHGSEVAMWVGLRLLTHSSHAVAARAVRHCATVGAHTQPATHSGAPGTLLLPLGQHLARGSGQGSGTLPGQHGPPSAPTDPFLSKAAGFRAADTRGASGSHKGQRGRPKPHPLLKKAPQEGKGISLQQLGRSWAPVRELSAPREVGRGAQG